jgi:pimeloyl-ACP methyl ester carboxylesterase
VRRIVSIVAAGLVAVSSTAVGPVVVSATADTKPAAQQGAPAISFSRCDDPFLRSIGAKCGTLTVPLDWAHPALGQVSLAVSRLRHTAPAKDYKGIMLANPGGPGGSGLAYAFLGYLMPDDVRAAYDWIGFDPRGVGSSEPALRCDPDYFVGPRPDYDIGLTPAAEPLWRALAAGYADDCADAGGDLLNHLTTVDNVHDMDAIRQALEVPALNFYGFSYGTYLAQVYATLFPGHVGRMVLDGNVDPRNVWYQANLNQDVAFETVIHLFFSWAASHDDVYDLGTTAAEVESAYYSARAALTTAPAGALGPSELTDAMLLAGYAQVLWPDEAQALSDLVHGDPTAATAWYEAFDGPGDDNGYAMYLATICTEGAWKPIDGLLADSAAIDATSPFFTWGNAWFNAPCSFWPAPRTAAVDVDGSEAPPVLLVSETLDAATPFSGSLEVRRRFLRSALIAVADGTTHANSLAGNACVDERIYSYLRDGQVPTRLSGSGPDVTCAALPLPEPAAGTVGAAAISAGAGSQRGASPPAWVQQLGSGRARM